MYKKTTFFHRLWVLTGLVALLIPVTVWAQSGQVVLINEVKPPEIVQATGGVPGLALDVTFTLLDANEQVLVTKIEPAAIQIPNSSPYPALVQQLSTPWSVVLLVDASATMANFQASAAFKTAKTALADSLGNQQNITFAILKFDSQAPTQLEFTTDADKIKKTITGLKAKQGGTSCLNNGVFEAINKLSGAPGRRAVIFFSASQDNCSDKTPQQVVALAQQSHVQLYAVGLKGYGVTRDQLDALVKETGGLASVKEERELGFAFKNMMGILANQWQAKATLFPLAGQQDATLQLTLGDATLLTSDPIPFVSPQDFIAPPEIHLKGEVLPTSKGLTFNLDITSKEKIKELRLDVTSKKTGLSVYTHPLSEFGETNDISVDDLNLDEDYIFTVAAVDSQGVLLSKDFKEFKYTPPQLKISLGKVEQPTLEKPQFSITVEPATPEGVVKFKIFLAKDSDPTTPLGNTAQLIPVGEPLLIAVNDSIEAGDYVIVVQALDGGEGDQAKVLAEQRSSKFPYQPPSTLDKIALFLKTNPLALAGIGGLCCFAVLVLVALVWVIVPKRSQIKEVEIFVPEKQRRMVSSTSSGVFAKDGSPVEEPARPAPPPPRREPVPQAAPPPPPAQAVNLPPAVLSGHTPATAMLRTPIRKVPCTIGRRDGNDIILKVDGSMGVSGQHCSITFNNGQYFVLDEGSSFGTTVSGQTISKGKPTPLPDGALIGLGPKVVIQFRLGQ